MRATTTEHDMSVKPSGFLPFAEAQQYLGKYPGPRLKRGTNRHAMDLAPTDDAIGSRKVENMPRLRLPNVALHQPNFRAPL